MSGALRTAIFSILVCALLPSPGPCAEPVVLDRIVAVVNNEAITWLELYNAMQNEMAQKLAGLGPEQRKAELKASEGAFLDSMVTRKIQLQEAAKRGIRVPDEELEGTIAGIRGKYGLGPEEFKRTIEGTGTDWDYYRENLRDQIILRKLVDREVRSSLGDRKPAEGQSKGASYHLRQIFFSLKDGGEARVDDKISEVYRALDAGDSFEAVAVRLSEGPNAASGGDLGVMEEASLSDELRQVLSVLSRGQVSDPIRSASGVHIIKLVRRVSGTDKDLEENFERVYNKWLGELKARAHMDIRL